MRLVDADALKEHLFVGADYDKAINDGIDKTEEEVFAFKCGWNDALKSVEQFAPTVDAVPLEDYKSMERTVNKLTKAIADADPVKHGHWIAHGKAFIGATIEACSECGELLCGYNKAYCPNCGAKMDEVTE